MTDKELIEQARVANDWNTVYEFIKQAKSQDTKDILRDRMIHLYLNEEYFAGDY